MIEKIGQKDIYICEAHANKPLRMCIDRLEFRDDGDAFYDCWVVFLYHLYIYSYRSIFSLGKQEQDKTEFRNMTLFML